MKMEQLPLRVRLRDTARFDSFVSGPNREAVAVLQDRLGPRVIWLWGKPGSGKTHLLQAACAAAGERGETAAYFDAGTAAGPAMLEGCDALDLVCIDGLDALASAAEWNAAIFRLHTLLQDGHGRLAVASTVPPASVGFTLADLRSRLLAGSVHQLAELDEAGLCRALQLRAASRGLELADEAALYLVHRLPRDARSLFDMLDHLDQASLVAQRRLTV
ncbi:MAG: DnaA regulatory inactivator Hda, partial [Steroidobacteraceae bacterium]